MIEVRERRTGGDVDAVEKIAFGGDVGGVEAARAVEYVQSAVGILERQVFDGHVVGRVYVHQRQRTVARDGRVQNGSIAGIRGSRDREALGGVQSRTAHQ